MFVPHGGENAQFGETGFSADQIQNALIFIRLEAMRFNQIRRDFDFDAFVHHINPSCFRLPLLTRRKAPLRCFFATMVIRSRSRQSLLYPGRLSNLIPNHRILYTVLTGLSRLTLSLFLSVSALWPFIATPPGWSRIFVVGGATRRECHLGDTAKG